MTDARPLPFAESAVVRQQRVHVSNYALLHVLSSVYDRPREALQRIDELIAAKGEAAAFSALSNDPGIFGDLAQFSSDLYLPASDDAEIRSFACYALLLRNHAMAMIEQFATPTWEDV